MSQIVFPLNPPKGLSKAHGLCALFWTFNLFLESSLCQYFRDHLLEELSADVSVLDAQDGVHDVAKVHFSMLFAILIISLELYQVLPKKNIFLRFGHASAQGKTPSQVASKLNHKDSSNQLYTNDREDTRGKLALGHCVLEKSSHLTSASCI